MQLVESKEAPEGRLVVACIPAYNEEYTIASVVMKTQKYVSKVVVYDDGSNDQTGDLACMLDAELIRSKENKGKGHALKQLFKYAIEIGADIVVTLDSDGQHNPDEIPRLLEPLLAGEADMVIGSRYLKGSKADTPLYRRIGLRIINSVSKGGGKYNIKDTQNGFRAYSRKALEAMMSCQSDGYGVETEQLSIAARCGLRIKEVSVSVRYNHLVNTSKKHPIRHGMELIETSIQLVVEKRPLLFLGVPGVILLLAGLFAGLFLLWEFNVTRYFSVPVALVAASLGFAGLFLGVAALMLYGISRIGRKIERKGCG